MAVGSQQQNVDLLATLTGLTHDIFKGEVQNNVKRSSICSMVYQEAGPGEIGVFSGQATKFAVDLKFKTGAGSTGGKIPDYVRLDAVQGEFQATRRYARIALDNLIELLASGEGAFENLGDRIVDHLWLSWESMNIRQAIGSSTDLVGSVETRTSSTVFVIKDAYGNVGTDPIQHLSDNSVIGWWDVDLAQVGGAARIASIDEATRTITIDSAATWEPTNLIAVNDLIYFATTNDITKDYFELERNLAPHGFGDIVDPTAQFTTVHGISETTHARWKPVRKASTNYDHLEVTRFYLSLGSKRGFKVSPMTDIAITHPVCSAQIAQSLMAFQQQVYTGDMLKGGYALGGGSGNEEDMVAADGVIVANIPLYNDSFFYHNVHMVLCREKFFYGQVNGDADFWTGDGSMWHRMPDYDGKDAFVSEYMNTFCTHRGANGALTGIVTEFDADEFTSTPNY